MISGSNIIGVLIALLLIVGYVGFVRGYKNKKKPFIILVAILVVLIGYFSFSNSYLFNQEKIIDDIFGTNADKIDSLQISNYTHINSFDYKIDYYWVTDRYFINKFFVILNRTQKTDTKINFRKYIYERDFRVKFYPEIYKNCEIKVLTLKGLGTFVTVKINEDELIYAPNEEFSPLIDTIIKKSKPFKQLEKYF